MKLCEQCKTRESCRQAKLCARADERRQREEDNARDALWKDGFLNGVAWRQANPGEPWDEAKKAAESHGAGVRAAPPARRDVPPGKWKVDMPDGTYGKMPGDPPGPASVRAVIGGYVYDVEPQTGRLRAASIPRGVALPRADQQEQPR